MSDTQPTSSAVPEPASASHSTQRVSTLVGDRLCIRCSYNLVGQPVLREGHYNMLIVRCPECGTVASLQEHPLLGRWAARWAVVLAGLWVLLLLVVLGISTGILYGITHDAGSRASRPHAAHLADLQQRWMNETGTEHTQQYWGFRSDAYDTRLEDDWWRTVDPAQLLADAGGWARVADWTSLWAIALWSPYLLSIGGVWALLLPHVRRRYLPLWAVFLAGVAGLFVMLASFDPLSMSWTWSIGDAIYPQIGSKVQAVALVVTVVPLAIGLLIGRSFARLLVRTLLPPRLRGSLAGLWLIDGLTPPPGTRLPRP